MEITLLSVLSLGFILGIKHAIEPDHVIAVSTIASKNKRLLSSSLAGIYWGIGHTMTLLITGVILILMKGEVPEKWALSLEFIVGIMLVYLGLQTMYSIRSHRNHTHGHGEDLSHSANRMNIHRESRDAGHRSYLKSLVIGFVHGLAGSGAMVLLTMSTVTGVWEGFLYILIFGAGTVIGMLFFTTVIGLPFVFSSGKQKLNLTLTRSTGLISVAFGLYYMYNLGFNEGLFELWI